jgi:plasmid stability protein
MLAFLQTHTVKKRDVASAENTDDTSDHTEQDECPNMASNNLADSYVYVLFRADGTPFYVGKGRNGRWLQHEQDAKRGVRSHKANIIRRMLADGLLEIPKVKIAEGLTHEESVAYEIAFIDAIGRRPRGPLVNLTEGGEGMPDPSQETREKLRAAKLGTTLSAEGRAKLSAAKLGKFPSVEVRAKMSVAAKGRTISIKQRANISAFFRGKPLSPEHRAKLREARIGFSHSAEARAKMSTAKLGKTGRPQSVESRVKLRAARLGKPLSDEHRAKLVIAWQRRRARQALSVSFRSGKDIVHAGGACKAVHASGGGASGVG